MPTIISFYLFGLIIIFVLLFKAKNNNRHYKNRFLSINGLNHIINERFPQCPNKISGFETKNKLSESVSNEIDINNFLMIQSLK